MGEREEQKPKHWNKDIKKHIERVDVRSFVCDQAGTEMQIFNGITEGYCALRDNV